VGVDQKSAKRRSLQPFPCEKEARDRKEAKPSAAEVVLLKDCPRHGQGEPGKYEELFRKEALLEDKSPLW